MPSTKNFTRYAIIATAVLLLAGLAGWYFFLNKQGQAITATDAGRGLNSAPPTFGGDTGSTYSNVISGSDTASSGSGGTTLPQLWHVTKTPVAGMGFVGPAKNSASSSTTTASSLLYFAERGTGYILKADTETGALERLTNKLFPRVYEAVFDSGGAVVLRSVNDEGSITSFAGEAPGQSVSSTSSSPKSASAGTATALSGKYLAPDIRAIVPNPGTHELFLLVPRINGGSDVILSSWDGAKRKTIFSSPLSGWKLFPLSDGRIFLSLLPADDTAGYAFEIQKGALIPRLQDVPGLTFLPRPSSEAALLGQSSGGDVSLFYSPKKGAGTVYLPIRTVADKCVWAPPTLPPPGKKPQAAGSGSPVVARPVDGPLVAYCAVPDSFSSQNFLADWYRGATHTSDAWWRIDVGTGQATPVLQPGDTGESFDVENPTIDGAGEKIAFMDAQDKSLWLLRISVK